LRRCISTIIPNWRPQRAGGVDFLAIRAILHQLRVCPGLPGRLRAPHGSRHNT
jgi:hypothetical protein